MSDVRKVGRPKLGEDVEHLTHVGFKADDETLAAIDKIVACAKPKLPNVRSPKSAAIRHALCAYAATLELPKT